MKMWVGTIAIVLFCAVNASAATIGLQPISGLRNFGGDYTFTVTAAGISLTYRWSKNATPLSDSSDGSHIVGSSTDAITVKNVRNSDEGPYTCTVSDYNGPDTSTPGVLTVNDPYITLQPVALDVVEGGQADFTVEASGSTSFSYQWRHNGNDIMTAIPDHLVIDSCTMADAGNYSCAIIGGDSPISNAVPLVVHAPAIWYVDKNRTVPKADGDSWETAFLTIQEAINVASAGDEVWVARGVYDEDRSSYAGGVLLINNKSIRLYGGFRGNETALKDRDWRANPTIIDGSRSYLGGPATHVVKIDGSGYPNILISGFTITGGNNDGGSGGGLYVVYTDPVLTIENCVIQNNVSGDGGGLYVSGSSTTTIRDCVFRNNSASATGGAIYAGPNPLNVIRCTFLGNSATDGGAINTRATNSTVTDSFFVHNNAMNGGAINVASSYVGSTTRLANCVCIRKIIRRSTSFEYTI